MNKLLFYFLSTLLFLTLSKLLAPDNISLEYIKTPNDLKKIIKLAPASAILEKTMKKGYLIKTYYQKYRILYAYRPPREIIVRTKRRLAEKSSKYLGMSLFRIDEDKNINTIPMPPGYLMTGNKKYGRWVLQNQTYYWKFYQTYRRLPKYFGWGAFSPDREFYLKAKEHEKAGKPFSGLNKEFGAEGSITSKFLPHKQSSSLYNRIKFGNLFKNYFKTNYN